MPMDDHRGRIGQVMDDAKHMLPPFLSWIKGNLWKMKNEESKDDVRINNVKRLRDQRQPMEDGEQSAKVLSRV